MKILNVTKWSLEEKLPSYRKLKMVAKRRNGGSREMKKKRSGETREVESREVKK